MLTTEHLDLSFDCVLPSAIFFNENLEPNCIKCYAVVRGLTKMKGYCFATNEYLAKILQTDPSSLRRWISSLQKEGFLEIQTTRNGIHWQREIYLSDKFKKCLRRLKNEHPPAQNQAPPCLKISTIIEDKDKEDKDKESLVRTAHPSADASSLTLYFLKNIQKRNPEFKPKNMKKWETEMDRLLRLDGRSLEDAKGLIDWVMKDMFWRDVILSPANFREKYNELETKRIGSSEKDLIRRNREYALKLKDRYPEPFKDLTFDSKFVIHRSVGKEIPFSLPEQVFKEALRQIFGG